MQRLERVWSPELHPHFEAWELTTLTSGPSRPKRPLVSRHCSGICPALELQAFLGCLGVPANRHSGLEEGLIPCLYQLSLLSHGFSFHHKKSRGEFFCHSVSLWTQHFIGRSMESRTKQKLLVNGPRALGSTTIMGPSMISSQKITTAILPQKPTEVENPFTSSYGPTSGPRFWWSTTQKEHILQVSADLKFNPSSGLLSTSHLQAWWIKKNKEITWPIYHPCSLVAIILQWLGATLEVSISPNHPIYIGITLW